MAESGGAVLGERDNQPPAYQLGDLGECCKLPQRGSGTDHRQLKGFLAYWGRQVASPGTWSGHVRGDHAPLPPPPFP